MALGEFERIYRGNVSAVTSYFARRCSDTQTVAELPADEIDELTDRIDAERGARTLLERCAELSALERAALELVDLDGLTPKEAAPGSAPRWHSCSARRPPLRRSP